MLKNTVFNSFAIAFASMVFPVPGGPNSNIPFQGAKENYLNNSGYY